MTDNNISILITSITGVVSVILGALIAPYISARVEKGKIKKGLKPELLKNLFELLRLKRAVTQIHNYERTHSVNAHINHNRLRNVTISEGERNELIRQNEICQKTIDDMSVTKDNLMLRIFELETDTINLLAQIKIYYDVETVYTPLKIIIDPHIGNSALIDHFISLVGDHHFSRYDTIRFALN